MSGRGLAMVLTRPMLDVARATEAGHVLQSPKEALPWVKRAALDVKPATQVQVRLLLQSGMIVVLDLLRRLHCPEVATWVSRLILYCILAAILGF